MGLEGVLRVRGQNADAGRDGRRVGVQAKAALIELRRAFNDFNQLSVRYEAARTRLMIAEACDALGDQDAAGKEAGAGRSAFRALCVDVMSPPTPAVAPPEGLTQRELELLRLLAQGNTNRLIAQELVVSEKIVASHVSHIFTKLGLTPRSAATAFGYNHNLV